MVTVSVLHCWLQLIFEVPDFVFYALKYNIHLVQMNIWSYSGHKLLHSIETGHSANIFCTKFIPETSDELVVSGAGDAEVNLDAPNFVCLFNDAVHFALTGFSTKIYALFTFSFTGRFVFFICLIKREEEKTIL